MGEVSVSVTVTNMLQPACELRFDGLVDTGAFGLVLPSAWKQPLGTLPQTELVEIETADRRIVTAEVCGPVRIQLAGFRSIAGEVVFVDMAPGPRGRYEPLVGYTILELSGLAVDMVTHRLVARKHFPVKSAHAAA